MTGATKAGPTKRKKLRKEEIVAEATRLFAERGYEGASMGDLAERVGLRKASLFHHFASKDVLYATVLGQPGRAAVSPTTLEFPEEVRVSKPIGQSYCGVVVHAGVLPQCDLRKLPNERSWCFELAKDTLTVREEIAATEYTKIAD